MLSRALAAVAAALILSLALAVPAATAPAAPSAARMSHLAGCFGHLGVQASNSNGPLIAFECVYQPSGDGGALYWSANEAAFCWDKHPADGLLWVTACTLHPAPDAHPAQAYQAFWVGIGRGTAMCTVISPGYGQHPAQCEHDGTVVAMDARRQASYDGLVTALQQAGVPDCAWSATVTSDEAACDIDS